MLLHIFNLRFTDKRDRGALSIGKLNAETSIPHFKTIAPPPTMYTALKTAKRKWWWRPAVGQRTMCFFFFATHERTNFAPFHRTFNNSQFQLIRDDIFFAFFNNLYMINRPTNSVRRRYAPYHLPPGRRARSCIPRVSNFPPTRSPNPPDHSIAANTRQNPRYRTFNQREKKKAPQKKLISLLLRILRRLSVSKTVTDKLYSSETRKTRKTAGKERIRAFLELRIFWKWNDIVNSSPFCTFIKYVCSYFFCSLGFFSPPFASAIPLSLDDIRFLLLLVGIFFPRSSTRIHIRIQRYELKTGSWCSRHEFN